jgi:soluble lytic murein transglycosylase-like protein
MTRMKTTARPFLLAAIALGALGAADAARAGALYRCERAGAPIAYTNRPEAGARCTVISRYDDATAHRKPARGSLAATRAWDYQEHPDVRAASAGAASTAPAVVAGAATTAPPQVVRAPVAKAAAAAPARAAPKVLRGAVYRVDRGNGVTEYTNVKPHGGPFAVLFTYIATCLACDVHSTLDWTRIPLHLDEYRDEIARAASDYGVSKALLRAVIHAESAFNPLAISAKGAQGLMQLMPGTAGDLGVANVFDAAQNIEGGARYLARLLKDFHGDERLATAAYNAGEAAVQKYGDVPPYDETRLYVQRVATLRDRYEKAL